MPRTKLLIVDLAASTAVLFGAVWIYEISNWISLGLQGYPASISIAGALPLGVVSVSPVGPSPLTKGLQVAIAVGLLLPALIGFARARLLVAEAFVLSTAGVYLASFYWEMLSVLTVLPIAVHTGIFLAGTCSVSILLARGSDRLRHILDLALWGQVSP
jgi:hypothetical protein